MSTAVSSTGVSRSLAVGDAAPDFILADAAGATRRLSDFRGSPVVLAFPARADEPWDPARAEYIDSYHRLVAQMPGDLGPQLLRVGGGGDSWRELTFAGDTAAIPVVAEENAAVLRAYGVADGVADGSAVFVADGSAVFVADGSAVFVADGSAVFVADGSAVFVVDEAGVVRWRSGGEAGALPHPDEVARALTALRPAGDDDGEAPAGWSRRAFLATVFGASLALALAPGRARAVGHATGTAAPLDHANPVDGFTTPGTAAAPVTLRINGRDVALQLEPRVTLLDALREYAGLTGSKKGCDHGQCGACTVHVDGHRVLSCLSLAVMQQGKAITTIEGLAATAGGPSDALHPMQTAFIAHDGFQCGYCTSGQIMSATAVVHEPWGPSDDDVREAMSGNLCRCGAYPGIVAAVQEVRGHTTAAAGGA